VSKQGNKLQRAYDRGRRDTRLDGHDSDIHELHGTVLKLVNVSVKLSGHIQKLAINASNAADSALQMASALKIERDDAASALKTEKDDAAAALKTEKDEARDTLANDATKSTSRWSKLQTVAAMASATVGFLGYEYLTHPHG
jgi:hypothetical protein